MPDASSPQGTEQVLTHCQVMKDKKKKKSISSSLAIKSPFKIQENILGQYVQLLLPKLLKLLGGVGTSWT